jgi:hypothetical protein
VSGEGEWEWVGHAAKVLGRVAQVRKKLKLAMGKARVVGVDGVSLAVMVVAVVVAVVVVSLAPMAEARSRGKGESLLMYRDVMRWAGESSRRGAAAERVAI